VEGVLGIRTEPNPEPPIVSTDIAVRARWEQFNFLRRRWAASAYEPLICVNQMQRMALADIKKRCRDLVDHLGTLLRSRIKPKDEWTRLVLLHHPAMDRDLVHARNLDPVIIIRDRQQLAGQLLVRDALRSDYKTDIWRQREQLVEEVIELVNALCVAPYVIEPVDNDVKSLPFGGEFGCGNPDG